MKYATLFVTFATVVVATEDFTKYHSNGELYDQLKEFNDHYQNISHLYSIGASNLGEELWVLMITLAPAHESGIPNVKIVGNIHGDEPVGRELIIFFIKMLLKGYSENNEDIIQLLERTKIHFLPSINPDGFTKAIEGECEVGPGRRNANDIDLNRNFLPAFSWEDEHLFQQRETETAAIINWMTEIHFVLSISIHSGSSVVVYPYDESTSPESNAQGASLTDDDDVFKHIAFVYATNTRGAIYEICPEGRQFEKGIINGAEWYSAKGTMGDYNYVYHGCMELTVEVSCCKYPHPNRLEEIVENHVQALTAVIWETHQGVKGVVTCQGLPAVSHITVLGRNISTQTTEDGEYWRILLPGRYFLQVESKLCRTEMILLEIPKYRIKKHSEPFVLNIHLKKLWEDKTDEIEFGTMENEEELNTTIPNGLLDELYTTGNENNEKSVDIDLFDLTPRMESSVSLSINLSPSLTLIINSSWMLFMFRR